MTSLTCVECGISEADCEGAYASDGSFYCAHCIQALIDLKEEQNED
jgi:hypothetical protein